MTDAPEPQEGQDLADAWTTEEAARVLRVSRRRVQQLLQSGEIAGEQRGRVWYAYQWSVNEYLKEHGPGSPRVTGIGRERPLESPESAREARRRVEDLARELGRLEGRLELTERAASTVAAERDRLARQLEEEREERRRERERADLLRDELEAARLELAANRTLETAAEHTAPERSLDGPESEPEPDPAPPPPRGGPGGRPGTILGRLVGLRASVLRIRRG
jgi:excisionase family DNA binding protein